MEFLNAGELTLNKAGYLVSKLSDRPVTHEGFVQAQKDAHFSVLLAKELETVNLKQVAVPTLESLVNKVKKSIYEKQVVDYGLTPEKLDTPVLDAYMTDIKNWEANQENQEKSDAVTQVLQKYNTLKAVEEVGDYFTEGLVRLAKIYPMSEIIEAEKLIASKV